MTPATPPPSGHQFEITHGEQRATIVEVGAGVRTYSVGDRDVLHPYDLHAMCDGAHGTPLVPWPNRLGDGSYTFDDEEFQVALTEPGKGNAIHGLLRWRSWRATEHLSDRVTMATRLHPTPGYPFDLTVKVEYALTGQGLRVATTATNLGDTACPYGHGQHPYLSPGLGPIDTCTLQFGAEIRIITDPQRQLPVGTEPVTGTRFDFTKPRRLDDLKIDHAFTGLARDVDQRAWTRLTGTDGATAALWVDATYPFVELYTADTLAPQRRRAGLGAEPMTCPPNAFKTGDHVIRLEPGHSQTTTWGACLVAP
ncbi:MAG: aldose 1-epimerase family protein [Nakamurella sp.]